MYDCSVSNAHAIPYLDGRAGCCVHDSVILDIDIVAYSYGIYIPADNNIWQNDTPVAYGNIPYYHSTGMNVAVITNPWPLTAEFHQHRYADSMLDYKNNVGASSDPQPLNRQYVYDNDKE